jgi:hypothetical protein
MEATPLDTILQSLRGESAGKSLWQSITGFDKNSEATVPHAQRRQSLRKLLHAVKQLISAEIQLDATLPPEEKEERTIFWNPLPSICNHLGIARSKLTSFMKELTGVAAHELIDQERVRDLKTKLRDEIRVYAREWREKQSFNQFHQRTFSDMEVALAAVVKQRRADTGIGDSTQLALSYNIPTHPRLYRACLVVHKKSPAQLEAQIVAEVIDELLEADSKLSPDVQEKYPGERGLEHQIADQQSYDRPERLVSLNEQLQVAVAKRAKDWQTRMDQIAQRLQKNRGI